MPKVLIIGLDGADWRVLQPYLDDGTMPDLARLIETGVWGPLRSTIPPQSPVAWASFLTGQDPGMHGVFDFRERSPFNPTRMVGVTSRSICSETFLHVLSRHNRLDRLISILAQMDIFSFLDSPEEPGVEHPAQMHQGHKKPAR